jgi:hypothetical protein
VTRAARAFAAATAAAALAGAAPVAAQVGARPGVPAATRGDVVPRDTARRVAGAAALRDSLRDKPLVEWAAEDSVMRSLLGRPGFQATRYQGETARFDAATRGLVLAGAPAAVGRGAQVFVGDTLIYSDANQRMDARGPRIVVRDPGAGDDVNASGFLRYDIVGKFGTASDARTTTTMGNTWVLFAHRVAFQGDSTAAAQGTQWLKDGAITSCTDSTPHYHFRIGEGKYIGGKLLVARPATLYIGEVPVAWIPFLFQDTRDGRRSGVLTPRFGAAELLRNSPTYRRTVENIGYYFAISDYLDAATSLDWRSGARPSQGDPGWVRLNGELRYNWLDRFLRGRIGVSRLAQADGQRNLSLSWSHAQDFSVRRRLTANLNYVSSTTVQRQTTVNPFAALATITSQLNYTHELGPLNLAIGGTRRQYPGRDQVDQDFPSLNLSSKPIELASWLTWTPSVQASNSESFKIDAPGQLAFRYAPRPDGTLDSVRVDRASRNTSVNISTPFKVRDFNVQLTVRYSDRLNDFPEPREVIAPSDTARRRTVVFGRTFLTALDWDASVNLPIIRAGFLRPWNLTPSITMQNVDPAAFWVRSERTGGDWVGQSKRLTYNLSVSPTVFGLFPGFGPVSRFRHAINPSLSWGYSPAAQVSDEFLAALGQTRAGYLGALAQNRVSLTFNTNLEAKLRGTADTARGNEERKVRLLTLNFSPLTWDFERARATGQSGFATDRFGTTVRSDLLPGLDFGVDWSLFQGSILSDTAQFSPYLESVRASLNLSKQQNPLGFLGGAFAWLTGERPAPPTADTARAPGSTSASSNVVGDPFAGGGLTRPVIGEIPSGQGWQANFTVSSNRPRPPTGSNVVVFDPEEICRELLANPVLYQACLTQNAPGASGNTGFNQTTAGGPVFAYPAQTSVQARLSFNLTPKWAAQWQTSYDVERADFASQIVSLQRDLHDWRAIFSFTQAANGNFGFTFFVALKAAPDLKFDYNRQTFRGAGVLSNP